MDVALLKRVSPIKNWTEPSKKYVPVGLLELSQVAEIRLHQLLHNLEKNLKLRTPSN